MPSTRKSICFAVAWLLGIGGAAMSVAALQEAAEEEDVMARIMRLMHSVAQRMETEFDVGIETLQLQDEVLSELDNAIKVAASQTKRTKDSSKDPGDKRKSQDPDNSEASELAKRPQGTTSESGDQPLTPGEVTGETRLKSGALDELRSSWGKLPPRDREELIQGSAEKALTQFKSLIDDYYRALQEASEDHPYQKP